MAEINSDDQQIEAVARVLRDWNPLGDDAEKVRDLDGYKTEAIDIFVEWPERADPKKAARIIMELLNEAFNLSLNLKECCDAATKISAILNKKR
jgi:Domain of unknown function (DUF1871)